MFTSPMFSCPDSVNVMETEKKELDKILIKLFSNQKASVFLFKICTGRIYKLASLLGQRLIMDSPGRVELGYEVANGVAGLNAESPKLLSKV